mgnify:CR=1 FL=1
MQMPARLWPYAAAMALVVLASNVLVQFPVSGSVGGVALADILTWGAFTYPLSFLVTDLANRAHGPAFARSVVFTGFGLAIASSLIIPPLLFKAGLTAFELDIARLARIAIASGVAFLTGQLLDVTLFNRLRQMSWWRAPLLATLAGSIADTAVFFTLAFAAFITFIGPADGFALESAPFLGGFGFDAPRWASWAAGDLAVKLIIAALALAPYRMLMNRYAVWTPEGKMA